MREPGTAATIAGAITNALTAIKDFPLWLLTGIALFLIAFLIVPAPQSRSGQWTALGPIPHRKVRIGSFPAVPAGQRRGRSTSISGLPSRQPKPAYLAIRPPPDG